jgi:hypothetical protein
MYGTRSALWSGPTDGDAALRQGGDRTFRDAQEHLDRFAQQLASMYKESRASAEELAAVHRETELVKSQLVQQRGEATRCEHVCPCCADQG